jgi:hypothetical protein
LTKPELGDEAAPSLIVTPYADSATGANRKSAAVFMRAPKEFERAS